MFLPVRPRLDAPIPDDGGRRDSANLSAPDPELAAAPAGFHPLAADAPGPRVAAAPVPGPVALDPDCVVRVVVFRLNEHADDRRLPAPGADVRQRRGDRNVVAFPRQPAP